MVGTQRRVGGDDDAYGTIHAREFFDDDGIFDVSQACAAILLREDGAHVAELPEFLDDFEREGLVFVPLHDMRRDLGGGEFAHFPAQLNLLRRVIEIHISIMAYATRTPSR